MIISTGMRTDIPAFYSKWFLNRIEEGFVYVKNPYNDNQITKYVLSPNIVDCICFCTKNPTPMLSHLDNLKDYKMFWFVTITPYGKDYEPNVPEKEKVIESFKILSKKLGKNCVGWRYDPIFYGDGWNKEKHIECFKKIASELSGYTDFCVISFLDLYEKVKKNAPKIYPPTVKEQVELAKEFVKIGKQYGIKIKSCYETAFLKDAGVDISGCQTKETIENAINEKLEVPKKKNARGNCNCLLGQDIGVYNTCGHLCKYCYANMDKEIVLDNMKKHNPNSPLLIGEVKSDEKITIAHQESYKIKQINFFNNL